MAAALDLEFALFHKERKKANEIARMILVGNVEGKVAILVDDMADTCGTLALAAKHLLSGGATRVLALVTHGILSGPALKVLGESRIDKLIVTNSIPQREHILGCDKVVEIDIAGVLAEAVRRSHYGESVSGALLFSASVSQISSRLTPFLSPFSSFPECTNYRREFLIFRSFPLAILLTASFLLEGRSSRLQSKC